MTLLPLLACAQEMEQHWCVDTREGPWIIKEEHFTEQRALKAAQQLEEFVTSGTEGIDWVSIENDLTMVRGYLFRDYLRWYASAFGHPDADVLAEFCEFVVKEGRVKH